MKASTGKSWLGLMDSDSWMKSQQHVLEHGGMHHVLAAHLAFLADVLG